MQSPTPVQPQMSEEDVRRGIAELSPWFYSFDLGRGLTTTSAVPDSVRGIFLHPPGDGGASCARALRPAPLSHRLSRHRLSRRVSTRWPWRGWALRRVVGLEPREENLRRAQFVAAATGLPNLEFVPGRVENLAADTPVYPLTLLLGVLYHVMDPMLCLRQLSAVTGELCVLETQVVDEVEGFTEWGSRHWTYPYRGILALIDESGEFDAGNRESGVAPLVTCPSPRAVEAMLRHAGFRRVEFVPPAADAYEQHARRKRVVVAAWK